MVKMDGWMFNQLVPGCDTHIFLAWLMKQHKKAGKLQINNLKVTGKGKQGKVSKYNSIMY